MIRTGLSGIQAASISTFSPPIRRLWHEVFFKPAFMVDKMVNRKMWAEVREYYRKQEMMFRP